MLSIFALASSNPCPTITWCPIPLRYAIQSRCTGDTTPPVERFISIHNDQAGTKRSGTPATVPEAFSAAPWLALLSPPFGTAKIRTSGHWRRNQLTSRTCSRCSDGAVKMGAPIPKGNNPLAHLQSQQVARPETQRTRPLCCNGRRCGRPLVARLSGWFGIG